VRGVAAGSFDSFAGTHSGGVLGWGSKIIRGETEDALRPTIVEGFGRVCVRRVCISWSTAYVIGEDGEVFSWGDGLFWLLGHGDAQGQPSPKHVEALPGVRVSDASIGDRHALALAEDGLVYAWGDNWGRAVLGNRIVEGELLPKPVEALRGARVGSVAASGARSYAVANTG
jgi:alpha-tubulin suppressor-like RCC1 family protein